MNTGNDLISKAKQYSPLGLAYIGDGIFELMVREKIIQRGNMPVYKLHTKTVEYVCAKAQSAAVELVMPILSEDEINIYKRGRNANANHTPKNSTPHDYRRATGLEALFGYLYISQQHERISELFEYIYSNINIAD